MFWMGSDLELNEDIFNGFLYNFLLFTIHVKQYTTVKGFGRLCMKGQIYKNRTNLNKALPL